MYGYIYKTKNNITNEIYIGQKKSNKFDKNYYGSGKKIKEDIKKYGKNNFNVKILITADNQKELDELEIKYIKKYKKKYKDLCINRSIGGYQKGGNTLLYADESTKNNFKEKMTLINNKRCKSESFKKQASIRMKNKYSDPNERIKQSAKIKESWSNEKLKKEQSERLKEYYKENKKDNSYLNKKCLFKLNGEEKKFDSVKSLKLFLKEEFNVTFKNPRLKELLETHEEYVPFHNKKENLIKLTGMKLYYLDESVETKSDECNSLE